MGALVWVRRQPLERIRGTHVMLLKEVVSSTSAENEDWGNRLIWLKIVDEHSEDESVHRLTRSRADRVTAKPALH